MSRLAGGGLFLTLLVSTIFLAGCPPSNPGDSLPPEARFETRPDSGNLPLVVQFSDQSRNGTSPIQEWVWDFGDGVTSTDRNPRHTYYLAGNYAVKLRVTSVAGTSTRAVQNAVSVSEPAIVVSIGPDGGALEAEGASLNVPRNAFDKQVVLSIASCEGSIRLQTAESETLVSDVFPLVHDQDSLYVDPRTPMILALPFTRELVPEAGRNTAQLQIVATLDNGLTMPIPGEVYNGKVYATIGGLPQRACYGVVYRPQSEIVSFDSDELAAKAPTSYRWNTSAWRMCYTPLRLQELTALRIGNLYAPRSYDRRDWPNSETSTTLTAVRQTAADILVTLRDSGFISPTLVPSEDNEYTIVFYPLNEAASSTYEKFSDLVFSTSIFGHLVFDVNQLIAVSKRNVNGIYDEQQEMEFANALGQEFYRTIFRGYDYPDLTQLSLSDRDAAGQLKQVPFSLGFEDGLAAYIGQSADGLDFPRSLGPNEYSKLDQALFAPWANGIPGYSYSTQDFFFYVLNAFAPADPYAFIADSYEGVLELIRVRAGRPDVEDFDDVMREARNAVDIALDRFYGATLADVYWDYAYNRAYGHDAASRIRRSEQSIQPNTFSADQFTENGFLEHTYVADNETLTIQPSTNPELARIPPLATRAILLNAGNLAGELRLAVNAYEWTPDLAGNSVRLVIYRERLIDEEEGTYAPVGSPVELTPADSQVTLDDFGEATGESRFDRAIILMANLALDRTFEVTLSATMYTGAPVEQTGTLGGIVIDASNQQPMQGVSISVRKMAGGTVGGIVGSATTLATGLFQIGGLPVGQVEVTASKSGYVTQKLVKTIAANQITAVQISMQKSSS